MSDEAQGQENANPVDPILQIDPAAQPFVAPASADETVLSLIRRVAALENAVEVLRDRLQRRGIR